MSLLDLYHQQKDSLLQELYNASPKESVQIIDQYLAKIADLKGEYVSNLTRLQARIALSILKTCRDRIHKLSNLYEQVEQVRQLASSDLNKLNHQKQHADASLLPSLNVMTAATISALAAVCLPVPIVSVPVAATLGGIAAKVMPREETVSQEVVETLREIQALMPQFDYGALLEELEEPFKHVDYLIEEIRHLEKPSAPKAAPKIEDHRPVLEFLQEFLGWYHRNQANLPEQLSEALKMRMEEFLPDLLAAYGIQIQYHTGERNRALFSYEEEVGEPTLHEALTVCPAFAKQDQTILYGRVIEPISVTNPQ